MLSLKNYEDKIKMMKYHRTSEMINLIQFFPQLSPVTDLIIVENEQDYLNNKDLLNTYDQNRVDTLKKNIPISGIENAGKSDGFYNTLLNVKKKDPDGVLVLFKIDENISERYERYAGISIGVTLGQSVTIEAVSKGFDGREVSKSICTHERYYIPWYHLRKLSINNFKEYQTYKINDTDYQKTRLERIDFLKSIGLDAEIVSKHIPTTYQDIPDFIWLNVIKNLLKKLETNEEILKSCGLIEFAISGHTEQKRYSPWGMFDKSRYTKNKN